MKTIIGLLLMPVARFVPWSVLRWLGRPSLGERLAARRGRRGL